MRLLKKRIATLAASAMLAATVFTGLPLPKAGAAEPPIPTAEIAMVNPGFEAAVGQDGKIPGWNVNYTAKDDSGGKVTHSVSGTVSQSGSKSLNLFDNGTAAGYTVEMISDKYLAIPGKEYTLSVWMNHNQPVPYKSGSVGGSIYLRFYDADNKELTNSLSVLNHNTQSTQGKFNLLSPPSVVAPPKARYVAVSLLITTAWTGNTYFDDVKITYPSPESGTVALTNPGFESAVGQDGSIPGWTASYAVVDDVYGKASYSVSNAVYKSGNQSLNLFDNSAGTHTVELVTYKYPIEPGKEYALSAWINPNQPEGWKSGSVGGSIQIRFYDANGNELTNDTVSKHYSNTSAHGQFAQVSLTGKVAPANAVFVSAALLITKAWTGNTYFDDVELSFKTPTPTLPPEDLSEKIIESDDLKAVISIPVPNAGFERGMTNGSITSWEKWAASSADIKHELAADKKYSGNFSLKLTDTTTSDNAVIQSEKLQVKPGVEYKASAMQYVASSPAPAGNGATFLLRFFNAQNVQVGADILQHSSTPVDLWFKAEVKGIAPNDAAYARLFALVNKGSTAVAYFDDFLFTYERQLMQLEIKSPEYAAKDDTFSVQLGSRYAESLTGAELSLAFDASVLELVDVTAHPDFGAIGNTSLTKEENNGVLNIHIARTDSGVVNGDVGIVYVTFKALDGQGDAILSLKAGSVLKTLKGSVIESKTFTSDVKTRTTLKLYKFDVNHDGVVNLVDLLLVAKNIGKTSDGVMVYYDLNGDKNIDIIDVGLLAQALADL